MLTIKETEELRQSYLKRLEGKQKFLLGDEAIGYGAIYAGCTFFAGYPITPASEIAELIALEIPKVGGVFIQMEDEIASISAVIGAAWAGARSMTATSGPGFSLMQENIGLAIMTETPCVIVDVQRSGPSTGQATKPAQGDFYQARWGTHGDHEIIVLSPYSVKEAFYLTIKSFELAEKYRTPVILLTDGEIGHMREPLIFPPYEEVKLPEPQKAKNGEPIFGGDLIPPMAYIGEGMFLHITSSTHKEDGMRDVVTQAVHEKLVTRLVEKIEKNRTALTMVEMEGCEDDADIIIVSFGVMGRIGKGVFNALRSSGKKVGFLRLITLWPFPSHIIKEVSEKTKAFYVMEMNLGQLNREIERFTSKPVFKFNRIGGVVPKISEVMEELNKVLKRL